MNELKKPPSKFGPNAPTSGEQLAPTPLTDRNCWREGTTRASEVVTADFARQLERECATKSEIIWAAARILAATTGQPVTKALHDLATDASDMLATERAAREAAEKRLIEFTDSPEGRNFIASQQRDTANRLADELGSELDSARGAIAVLTKEKETAEARLAEAMTCLTNVLSDAHAHWMGSPHIIVANRFLTSTTTPPILVQYRGILDRVVNAFLGTLKCPAFDLPTGLPDSSPESEKKMRSILKTLVQEHCGLTDELKSAEAQLKIAEQERAKWEEGCRVNCDALKESLRISDNERLDIIRLKEQLQIALAENNTLRAAQKACEECDAPTMEEVRQLRKQLQIAREAMQAVINRKHRYNVWWSELSQLEAALAQITGKEEK